MAGYSGTPLIKKLGVKPGYALIIIGAPKGYLEWLGPLPEGARVVADSAKAVDFIHIFSKDSQEIEGLLAKQMRGLAQTGMIWVSWPKMSSKVPTTLSENIIRETALRLGLVDVKVCAVDEVWSGLKLVIPVANRTGK